MKQTVEEAARGSQCEMGCPNCPENAQCIDGYHSGKSVKCPFILGAEWQKKQSSWVSVKDHLPKVGEYVLVLLKDHTIHTAYLEKGIPDDSTLFWMEYNEKDIAKFENVLAWMPIPFFDEILESNKDVLNRLKESGD